MSRKKLTRFEKSLFLAPLLMIGAAWGLQNWPPYLNLSYPGQDRRRLRCQNQLKQIQIALGQYAKDYDGRFPPLKGAPGAIGIRYLARSPQGKRLPRHSFSGDPIGWTDSLRIYLGSASIFICPSEPDVIPNPGGLPTKAGYTDFWFNSNLSALPKSQLANPASTLAFGDGNDGKDLSDATYGKSSLPPNWLTDRNSPAFRHLGGANYLMADGSVHWLKPDQLAAFGAGKDLFAIK